MSPDGDGSQATITALLRLETPGARSVAQEVGRLITRGELPAGARLPTVRQIGGELKVSPATISEAWQMLRQAGLIDTAGRNGTIVIGPRSHPTGVGRYGRVAGIGRDLPVNLATGTPDPALLPDIEPLVSDIDFDASVIDYLAPAVVDGLHDVLMEMWPFEPGSLTVVNGAMDGLARTASQLVPFGSRVAIENPTFPPLIDTLEQLGAELIPLDLDGEGPVPDSLSRALAEHPVAVFLQPRAHNPTGVSMTAARAQELATILGGTDTMVVENDHASGIAVAPMISLGRWLPEQTIRIHGFSKSHGPDLRLAAVGGREEVVVEVASNRVSGPGWSSRLLQRILVKLLTDPTANGTIERAREVYTARRTALVAALNRLNSPVRCDDGLNLWLPVADEGQALVTLAAHGVSAAPGSAFCIKDAGSDHLRVTVGVVAEEDAEEVAEILVSAARLDLPVHRA